jgi:hypothetical protein
VRGHLIQRRGIHMNLNGRFSRSKNDQYPTGVRIGQMFAASDAGLAIAAD